MNGLTYAHLPVLHVLSLASAETDCRDYCAVTGVLTCCGVALWLEPRVALHIAQAWAAEP